MDSAQNLLMKYNNAVGTKKGSFGFFVINNPIAIQSGIMLVGMNPSGNDPNDGFNEYLKCRRRSEGGDGDRSCFWGPKHEMMGKYDKYTDYIDLLPIRLTDQKLVDKIDPVFRGRLLKVTQRYIEEMKPKLIILVNRSALYYWGSNDDASWMGYQLGDPIKKIKGRWNLYIIQGLKVQKQDRINQDYFKKRGNRTNLEGSYLLQYCQVSKRRKYPNKETILTASDIENLLKEINPEWEKTLY